MRWQEVEGCHSYTDCPERTDITPVCRLAGVCVYVDGNCFPTASIERGSAFSVGYRVVVVAGLLMRGVSWLRCFTL